MNTRIGMLVLLAACGADDHVIKPGVIEFFDEQIRTETPESASVRTQFQVRVFTFGGGCEALEDTTVEVVPDGAIVTPRDRTYISGDHGACTDVLQSFEHVASLSFTTPGTKVVRFRGRRLPGESRIEISHAIVVSE